jgi:hypothetical protein
MSRAIGNWRELIIAVKENWPAVNWEECPVIIGIRESALFFDQVKLLFGVHGSLFANLIFMQQETILVTLEMEQWLLSFLWLGAYTGKYMTIGRDQRITWRGLKPNIVDIPYIISLLKDALEQIKVI